MQESSQLKSVYTSALHDWNSDDISHHNDAITCSRALQLYYMQPALYGFVQKDNVDRLCVDLSNETLPFIEIISFAFGIYCILYNIDFPWK